MFIFRARLGVAVAVIYTAVAAGSLPGSAMADGESHVDSTGIYRVPYATGLDVSVSRDHHTHAPVENRIDMSVGDGEPWAAAASGWIRAIVDFHGGPDEPAEVHSCTDDDDVPGDCSDYNNYVWIEHPNGEWTKYSHSQTGSVTGNGWEVGDWIEAGEVLGDEGDIGSASGPHLHWEVAVPTNPADTTPFSEQGGFIDGTNRAPRICDLGGDGIEDYFVAGNNYTAAPCVNGLPSADAGGPYVVDEGSALVLDGTGSSDPDGRPLGFQWEPADQLASDDTASPVYDAVDDVASLPVTLTVVDPVETRIGTDSTTITVTNLPPAVSAVGDSISEGGEATVSGTVTDPGALDTHTAVIDWGDGTQSNAPVVGGSIEATHVYGDDGAYPVSVTVTDDDGGVGSDTAGIAVGNLAPTLTFIATGVVSLPGGEYIVSESGGLLPQSADGSDPGSDDLTFAWTSGGTRTYYNDGVGPEPAAPSPFGVFPFLAHDDAVASFATPGVYELGLILSDDDGGTDTADVGVIVTGTSDRTWDRGAWMHQYSAAGFTQLDAATAEAYRTIVAAGSSVFSEQRDASTRLAVHEILSPASSDRRTRAESELMQAWLNFASGAVAHDASVPTSSGAVSFLDLVTAAEATILDPAATNAQLHAVEQSLAKVKQAG